MAASWRAAAAVRSGASPVCAVLPSDFWSISKTALAILDSLAVVDVAGAAEGMGAGATVDPETWMPGLAAALGVLTKASSIGVDGRVAFIDFAVGVGAKLLGI